MIVTTSVIAQRAHTCASLSIISERTGSHRIYLNYSVKLKAENVTFIFVEHYVSSIFIRIISDDVEYQDLPITKPYPQFLAYCHNCGDTWLAECDDLKSEKTDIEQIIQRKNKYLLTWWIISYGYFLTLELELMSRLVTSSTLRMMSKVTWSKSRTHDDLTIETLFSNMESVVEAFKSVHKPD